MGAGIVGKAYSAAFNTGGRPERNCSPVGPGFVGLGGNQVAGLDRPEAAEFFSGIAATPTATRWSRESSLASTSPSMAS